MPDERSGGRRSRGGRPDADFGQPGTTCAGRFVSPPTIDSRTLVLAAVCLTILGCVPLPTNPSSTRSGRSLAQEGRRSFLRDPAPRYEELQFPGDTPPLDAPGIEILPVTYGDEFSGSAEIFPLETTPIRPSDLAERTRIERRGSGLGIGDRSNSRGASPTVRIGSISRETAEASRRNPSPPGGSLDARRDHLLDELALFRGRDERDLADGERLAKHRIQVQLMALHFLLDASDSSHLEPLIDSLSHSHEPSQQHSLLVASFYESVDFEQKSAEILARLGGSRGTELAPTSTRSFRIAPPILCTRIDGLGRYRVVDRSTFRPGTELRLYVEIFGIENQETSGKYRQRLEVEFSLVDRDGTNRGSQTSRTEGPPVDEPVVDSFLNLRYSIPREVPFGRAKLTVTVRDLIAGTVSRRTVDLGIEP